MCRQTRCSPEVRERAVRMVIEHHAVRGGTTGSNRERRWNARTANCAGHPFLARQHGDDNPVTAGNTAVPLTAALMEGAPGT